MSKSSTPNRAPGSIDPNAELSEGKSPALTPLSAVRYGGEQYAGSKLASRFYQYEETFSSDSDSDNSEKDETNNQEPTSNAGKIRTHEVDPQQNKTEYNEVTEDLEFHRLLHRHTLQYEQMQDKQKMSEKDDIDKKILNSSINFQERQHALEVINQAIMELEQSSKNREAVVAEKQEHLKYLIENEDKKSDETREGLEKDFSDRKAAELKSMVDLKQSIITMNLSLKEQKDMIEVQIKETEEAFRKEKEKDLIPEIQRWAEANRKNAEILDLIEQVKRKYDLGDEDVVWNRDGHRKEQTLLDKIVATINSPRDPQDVRSAPISPQESQNMENSFK